MVKALAAACLMLVAGMVMSTAVAAQAPHDDIPTNSHLSAGEQGWTCDDGFKQIAKLCVLDTDGAPSRGAWEVYNGGQWRCRSGYTQEKGFCVPLTAPEHATLVGSGGGWQCDWGFQKSGSRCKEIEPPPHGYVDGDGRDWACYPGYERSSDQCVASPGGAPASASGGAPKATESPPEDKPPP
jgi:hypothetical protein